MFVGLGFPIRFALCQPTKRSSLLMLIRVDSPSWVSQLSWPTPYSSWLLSGNNVHTLFKLCYLVNDDNVIKFLEPRLGWSYRAAKRDKTGKSRVVLPGFCKIECGGWLWHAGDLANTAAVMPAKNLPWLEVLIQWSFRKRREENRPEPTRQFQT